MKTIWSRTLSLVLCAGMFSVAAFSQTAKPGAAQGPLEWQSDTSPVTLTAYVDFPHDAFNGWGKDPVSREITRRTGVTIDLEVASTEDSQKLNLMLASNELPDFVIINSAGPMRQLLYKQDFVAPLSDLIDEYAPKMWSVMDADQAKVYTESDGKLYMLVDYYCDIDKIAKVPGNLLTQGLFSINEPLYKEVGSPPMGSLKAFKAAALKVKEKHPELPYVVYSSYLGNPRDPRNMAQLVNRIYGGGNVMSIGKGDSIHLNFRDPSYLKAVQYINDLYRSKIFNAENFTVTNDAEFKELALNKKIFAYFGQCFNIYNFDQSDKGPYIPFAPPLEPGVSLKLNNMMTGIGGWHGVFVSLASKNKERAIKYLEFMVSKEGQMLMTYGIEGEHHTLVNGMPKKTPLTQKVADESWAKYTKEFGIYNYNINWLTSSWADSQAYYIDSLTNKFLQKELDIYNKYATNERLQDLVMVPADTEDKVTETKVMDLWQTSFPKMCMASSEKACTDAYNKFVQQAEKLGLAKLEAAYTAVYKTWKTKLAK